MLRGPAGPAPTRLPPLLLLLQALLLLLLPPRRDAQTPGTPCVGHTQCAAGEFCSLGNNTNQTLALERGLECESCAERLCTDPANPTTATCNKDCVAVNYDCCSQAFRSNCQARQVFFSGETVPCSVCDETSVTVGAVRPPKDVTLRPQQGVQLVSGYDRGGLGREAKTCESIDATLNGHVWLTCTDDDDGAPSLSADSSNCSRKVYSPVHGFLYNQDPTWQSDAARVEQGCGGLSRVSTFNPLVSLEIEQIGKCLSAAELPEWAREAFVGLNAWPDGWPDGRHLVWGSYCVECAVEAGYSGGSATMIFYSDAQCTPSAFARQTPLVVTGLGSEGDCSFDSRRDRRYTAACDVATVGACPMPPSGVQLRRHLPPRTAVSSSALTIN